MPKPHCPNSFKTIVFVSVFLITLYDAQGVTAQVDITPPTTHMIQTPASPDGTNGWYKSNVVFNLQPTDLESGVKELNYRIDGGLWQKVTYTQTQNLASNPSFELAGVTDTGISGWEASVLDAEATYSQDLTTYFSQYATSSAKVVTTGGLWHGITNKTQFVPTVPYDNMNASVWVKTQGVTGEAKFNIYSVAGNASTGYSYTLLGSSPSITGTTNWTRLAYNFTVNDPASIGIYIDMGISGPGTAWFDAVSLTTASTTPGTVVTIATDREDHTFEYYSSDNIGNTEAYNCTTNPKLNCVTFKMDKTPPTNWRNSGAWRGLFGANHELWVYATVDDITSGLKVFSDKYQIHTETDPGYGSHSNILNCSSTWNENQWTLLITPPFNPGANTAQLLTPKTDFCNSNWKLCKVVRFYVEDMAGNSATKDFCINGPWIEFTGNGAVRANYNIDMLSEADENNTDGLIEAGGPTINFFSSSRDWTVRNANTNQELPSYDELWAMTGSKSTITSISHGNSGIYYINGDFTVQNNTVYNGFSTNTFNKIIFVNGDLTFNINTDINQASTLLFIVKGNVNIKKNVTRVEAAIFADGTINTASDVQEGDNTNTLYLYGVFAANNFQFSRTLQGTNNNDAPSESFRFEPKYTVNLRNYFSSTAVKWIYSD